MTNPNRIVRKILGDRTGKNNEADSPGFFGAEGYSKDVCSCGNLATHQHNGEQCCGGMMCCPNANR